MKDAGLPIGKTVVYTRKTDPNEQLGRPHSYVEKAGWCDTRVPYPYDDVGWDCGGDIEVFNDSKDMADRWRYLKGFATNPPIGGFYMWQSPFAVIRVGFALRRDQAKEYQDFFEDFFEGNLRRYRGA